MTERPPTIDDTPELPIGAGFVRAGVDIGR
jgi:hypothetical protein